MAKRDMKQALGASLKAEEQAVRSRFEKSDTVLAKKEPSPPERPKPDEKGEVVRYILAVTDNEDELISRVRRRCMQAGISADRDEVLRAGLAALDGMKGRQLERLFESLRREKARGPRREAPAFTARRAYVVNLRGASRGAPSPSPRQIIILRKRS